MVYSISHRTIAEKKSCQSKKTAQFLPKRAWIMKIKKFTNKSEFFVEQVNVFNQITSPNERHQKQRDFTPNLQHITIWHKGGWKSNSLLNVH